MTQKLFSFNGGVLGNNLAAGAGAGVGDTNFDALDTGGSPTGVYSNDFLRNGYTKVGKFTTPGTSARINLAWNFSGLEYYGRAYWLMPSTAPVSVRAFAGVEVAGTNRDWSISVRNGNDVQQRYYNDSVGSISSANYQFDEWHRVEWHVIVHPSAGVFEMRLYDGPEDTSTSWGDDFLVTGLNTGTDHAVIRFGITSNSTNQAIYLSDVGFSDVTWLGPISTVGNSAGMLLG